MHQDDFSLYQCDAVRKFTHTGSTHKGPLYREKLALVRNHLRMKTRSGCDCKAPSVLDIISKPTNARKCINVYYRPTHRIRCKYFGHSHGHHQGSASQVINRNITKLEAMHRYNILNFKTVTWLKIHIKN